MRALAAAVLALLPLAAGAQVRTDSSLGRAAVSLTGPNYLVPQDLGRLAGGNLFHSFQTFSIGQGESATFSTTTPGLANVIARVTGGDISRINGLVRVDAVNAQPSLWLINPAGIVFGKGAQVSVPGALHVTTANYVRFADGEFHADPSRASTFSSLAPEAYGFLGGSRATVRIEDGAVVRSQAPIDVVAGDFLINNAQLRTGSADIRVVAVGAKAMEVGTQGPVTGAEGKVTILQGGEIRTDAVAATPGGNIGVYAGELFMDGGGVTEIRFDDGTSAAVHTGMTAATSTPAPSGSITVGIGGSATILNAASIQTKASGSGAAGDIRFTANDLLIDGKGIEDTGLVSLTDLGSTAHAGTIDLSVAKALRLYEGASISSDTAGSGNAGEVRVSADSIFTDGRFNPDSFTGISSDTREETSSGSAGRVTVHANGAITMVGGSEISSTSNGTGNAGDVTVTAGSLSSDGSGSLDQITGIHSSSFGAVSGNAGQVDVTVDGSLRIVGGGEITADTWTSGHGGNVKVSAHELFIDGGDLDTFTGISSDAAAGTGSAGNVEVHAGTLTMLNGAEITSDSVSLGNAGSVIVTADTLTLQGRSNLANGPTAIGSRTFTPEGSGQGGNVQVTVSGLLSLIDDAVISSSTFSKGSAGRVSVSAGSLFIDGRDNKTAITGLTSQANPGATGNAGAVELQVTHDATITGSGTITSSTFSPGKAGDVTVRVAGNLTISGTSNLANGIYSDSLATGAGPAGHVTVNVGGTLAMLHGATIDSDTRSAANAGSVDVEAGTLTIEGAAGRFTGISTDSLVGAGGKAGDVTVLVHGDLSITNGGRIDSRTSSSGAAGTVNVHAGGMTIDGAGTLDPTGILSTSTVPGAGNAGRISVAVDGDLALRNSGLVSSATFSSQGSAGSVDIHANRVVIDGTYGGFPSQVSARSGDGASGQTGDISIAATDSITVSNGGQVTVANSSTVPNVQGLVPSTIALDAPRIFIASGGSITAQSSGNVDASNIAVTAPMLLELDSGSITTSANLGNGGRIDIDAGTVRLVNSQITTSVLGTRGNGGDISVHADVLRLETGFIQANTAARDAAGGNVAIDVNTLVASGGTAFIGGSEPIAFVPGVFALNVIQAAAPTGVSGAIELTSPVLDTSGALTGLGAAPLDTSLVGRSPCRVAAGSSLAVAGRGGLAPSARDAFRIDPVAVARAPFAPGAFALTAGPCASRHAAL